MLAPPYKVSVLLVSQSYCIIMEQRVFPLSREFYEDFTFYYPFGNSPAEDFLRSVSVADSREPTVLSLGCGDMRSPMFTILNNFGFEGDISVGLISF